MMTTPYSSARYWRMYSSTAECMEIAYQAEWDEYAKVLVNSTSHPLLFSLPYLGVGGVERQPKSSPPPEGV